MAIIARLCRFYFVDLLGFCLMDNHFHPVIRMHTSEVATNEALVKRSKGTLTTIVERHNHAFAKWRAK